MVFLLPIRLFHSSAVFRGAVESVQKSTLAQLRRSTGYSISHCKKALDLNDNNLEDSRKWLAKQAQAEGWAKATKLAGRTAKQGLVGISINSNNTCATMLELNCETDFVARNSLFVELAGELTQACMTTSTATHSMGGSGSTIHKELWSSEQVSQLQSKDGKTLADKVALTIGLCGENMALSRALKMSTEGTGVQLYGYAHPNPSSSQVAGSGGAATLLGRFGAVVAVRRLADKPDDFHLLKQLCLQIIGMNPESIGTLEELQKYADENREQELTAETATQSSVDNTAAATTADTVPASKEDIDGGDEESHLDTDHTDKQPMDKFLLKQTWLDDTDYSVAEMLEEAGLEVVDFVRMQVGEQQE